MAFSQYEMFIWNVSSSLNATLSHYDFRVIFSACKLFVLENVTVFLVSGTRKHFKKLCNFCIFRINNSPLKFTTNDNNEANILQTMYKATTEKWREKKEKKACLYIFTSNCQMNCLFSKQEAAMRPTTR